MGKEGWSKAAAFTAGLPAVPGLCGLVGSRQGLGGLQGLQRGTRTLCPGDITGFCLDVGFVPQGCSVPAGSSVLTGNSSFTFAA